jgi:putative toxin-antitoxin system antitoxin component (TIGR02293 family)
MNQESKAMAIRLERITTRAYRVFGNQELVWRWLRQPQPALGGQAPLDVLDTEAGTLAAEQVLARMEQGVPA